MTPGTDSSQSLHRINGYLVGRAVIGFVLMVSVMVLTYNGGEPNAAPVQWFFLLTALSYVFTFVTAIAIKRGLNVEDLEKIQPPFDAFYATGLVYLSGGWQSPLTFLYLLVIIGAAALLRRQGAYVAATASSLLYGALIALQVNNLIQPLNPFPLQVVGEIWIVPRVALHFLAFYTVAYLSGLFAEEFRKTGEKLVKAEDEILDLEHLKEAILQSMGGGLLALDSNNRVMFLNSSAAALLNRAGIDVSDPGNLYKVFDFTAVGRREVKIATKGVVLGYGLFPLSGRNGQRVGTILSFRDMTELVKLEDQLKLSDRMAAIGRLSAGLAHEIRNPLASLSGSVQMLSSLLEIKGEEQGILLDIIQRETERLNRLVTDFLNYARPGATVRERFDLCHFVDNLGFFFKQGVGAGKFELLNNIPEGFELVADQGQIEQVFLNLFKNSAESSPDGVKIKIDASHKGTMVEIVVSDDGPGIPEDIRETLFEPFVTTKDEGTGLGLALVHRVAQNHGGSVVAENDQQTGGAVFRILLRNE